MQAANELERLSKPEQEQEPVAIEYWLQDTMESGRWVTTGNMSRATAEDYCEVYPQGRIVEPSPPQRTEQEPVAHLWECIGRWSAYLVNNGKQADCAPPSWLIDAVNNATTPPKRTWVDLTPQDLNDIFKISHTGEGAVYLALKIIKEKNA